MKGQPPNFGRQGPPVSRVADSCVSGPESAYWLIMPNILDQLREFLSLDLPTPPVAPRKQIAPPADLLGIVNLPDPPPVRVDDPQDTLSGDFDGTTMRAIVNAARGSGVDPLTALAITGQESTFGRNAPHNPMQVRYDLHPMSEPAEGPEHLRQAESLMSAMKIFKALTGRQRRRTPNDPELILQAYNGMGKVQGGSEVDTGAPMYGGQTDLHGGRDRPYGKRILALREMLARQPAIQKLLR